MSRPIAATAAAVLIGALMIPAGGCVGKDGSGNLARQLESSRRQVRRLSEDTENLRKRLSEQDTQIHSLLALGEKRLEKLFYVERIELGRHTGGVNLDSAAGDDAIKVYLKPIDQDGHTIKAAGQVKIQLYDLAATPAENLIGQYDWPVEKLTNQWSSGFVAYHYSFVCPWKAGPPKHDQITVRVQFTDYLTGKVFAEQTVCKITLAGD